MQVKLRTVFLLCVYASLCCLVYIYPSLWVGTLVLVATMLLIAVVTARGFGGPDWFARGFSIAAWSWLVLSLGFYGETKNDINGREMLQATYRFVNLFRENPDSVAIRKPSSERPKLRYGTYMFSLHGSGQNGTFQDTPPVPSFMNALRLVACLTSLVFGTIVGAISHFIHQFRAVKPAHPETRS